MEAGKCGKGDQETNPVIHEDVGQYKNVSKILNKYNI